jgi:hypothetical protein
MLGAEDQVIAHPPLFKIFDLAQIAVGFRDERRPARCLLMSALGQKQTSSQSNQCPLYPQKRTLPERVGMSALCQKRTFCRHSNPGTASSDQWLLSRKEKRTPENSGVHLFKPIQAALTSIFFAGF